MAAFGCHFSVSNFSVCSVTASRWRGGRAVRPVTEKLETEKWGLGGRPEDLARCCVGADSRKLGKLGQTRRVISVSARVLKPPPEFLSS
jgi:hypothetical protein